MDKYKEFPDVSKVEVGGGGGGRRFAIIMLFLLLGIVFLYGVVSSDPLAVEQVDTMTATPTAVPSGVTVNVQQDGPAVNVNVQQDAPPPPPPDNAPALIAQQTALDARARADAAYNTAAALAPRVEALEVGHERLAAAPDIMPTLVAFEQRHGRLQSELTQLRWGVLGAFVGLALLGLAIGLMVFPHGRAPYPTPLTISENAPVQLHRANTVLHGASTVQNTTSGEPLVITTNKPTITKNPRALTEWERAYIQAKYNRLKTYTATSNDIWGYHGRNTLACIKAVVGEGE